MAAANSGLSWCGTLDTVDWFGHFMSPCSFETTASTTLLALTLVLILAQGTRLALIQQLRVQGKVRKGISGLNGSFIASALFLCGTHLLHFSVSVVVLRALPYHIIYHAALAVIWATISAFAIYTGRLTACVDFRPVTIPAALTYCISLYSFYRLYFDPHGVPLSYTKASIWTAMLQAVVAVTASWLAFRRAAVNPPTAALQALLGYESAATAAAASSSAATAREDGSYQPLAGGEAEAAAAAAAGAAKPPGGAGGPPGGGEGEEEDKATWIGLFVDACVYVWPETLGMQVRTVACLVLLVAMRVVNLAVPILYKRVVDTLAAGSREGGGGRQPQRLGMGNTEGEARGLGLDLGLSRLLWGAAATLGGGDGGDDEGGTRMGFGQLVWPWVALYLAAVFFQGGAGGGIVGFINNVRSYLWIPVSQDAYRRISLRVFDHVLDMDLPFHLRKKTGEVTRVVDRGTNAIQNILSTLLFNVLPQMFDVLAAATYLAQALEPTIAIIVFLTVGSYIPLTIIITEWRGSLRREMNTTDQVKSGRATDALLNYETVKYFTNERHESRQYAAAIDAYQSAEYRSMASINLLNVVQSAIMFCGIAMGLLVCAGGVSSRVLTVGDAVLFLSLMAQLYGPLNFFGSYYRTIQQYMIDMENLLELLGRKSGVEDSPAARELAITKGELVFDDVSFQYEPGRVVLRHVGFRVPGGQTIAFVGATGSGKSTVTRLIFRFYDVTAGAIRIDGQDIRGLTQASLRRAVGMVPQDTVLFNDTILHNIRYGNLAATDEQVFEAAKLACIHDTIVNRFPKGYDTVVGERGLRLSGGEKQRVAFARALLKNPAMLVLDEATSALDTITEKKIQAALADLRTDRTTVIVAHRLSTIADADIIVVLREGAVVESGGHGELLAAGGLYAEMWAKQAQAAATAGAGQGEGGNSNAGESSSLVGSTADLTRLLPTSTPASADVPAAAAGSTGRYHAASSGDDGPARNAGFVTGGAGAAAAAAGGAAQGSVVTTGEAVGPNAVAAATLGVAAVEAPAVQEALEAGAPVAAVAPVEGKEEGVAGSVTAAAAGAAPGEVQQGAAGAEGAGAGEAAAAGAGSSAGAPAGAGGGGGRNKGRKGRR